MDQGWQSLRLPIRIWAYRGASASPISKEKALELLPSYNFGKGFYKLSFINTKSGVALEFNELSVHDME